MQAQTRTRAGLSLWSMILRRNTDPYWPIKLCTDSFSNQSGSDSGGNGCHWRPRTDCKEKWILITITSGVKHTNTSHSAPSLCKIIHLITVNVCKYVCKCKFMRGLWVGLIILLWGVIVNQSRHVLQRVIRFTTYSLPVSFVMPFAVWPSLV